MQIESRIYHFVSVIVTVAMLMQVLSPALWPAQVLHSSPHGPSPTAVAQGAAAPDVIEAMLPQEMVGPLLGTGLEGAEPTILMDANARQVTLNAPATEPAAFAEPLSLTRIQSAYVPGSTAANTLIITFTVSNNRPPTLFPHFPLSATITETVTILNDFDFSADANTVRNVVLVDTLTSDAALLQGSPQPDQAASELLFNLGDVPPMSSITATLRLTVPASVADFTALDVGASAYGSLQGRQVTAAAAPALLAPDSFADYLRWTPDADIYDTEMLRQAAQVGGDPVALFAYVRSLGYESYPGSLRGTRGTLWSAAGNSLDQASLLIAMLRANGVPARYAHGPLSLPLAQELIRSMFPEPVEVVGHVPSDAAVSDPVNDPILLAETQDHWWVQAYIGGQWLSLDPTFATANPGDVFATAVDVFAEAPDVQRHKVTLRLKVERFSLLSAVTGTAEITYPLTATFNTVELVGRPVTLNHLVNTSGGGAVFTIIEHTYVPYFIVGDYEQVVEGAPYQDIFSNFVGSLSSVFTTGTWLLIESTDPAGNTENYEREIKDLIGAPARQGGGVFDLSETRPDTAVPLFGPSDAAQIHVLSYDQRDPRSVQQQWAHFIDVMPGALKVYAQLPALEGDDPVNTVDVVTESFLALQRSQIHMLNSMQAMYSVSEQGLHDFYSDALLSRSYVATPKLLLLSQSVLSDTVETSFELLNVRERIIPYPQQNTQAAWLTQMLQSVGNKAIETDLMQKLTPGRNAAVRSAFLVMEEARATNTEIVLVTQETLYLVNSLNISDQAKARITQALTANDTLAIQVPREMVFLNGRDQIGWAEIDMETGYVEYVYENGRRASEYGIIAFLQSHAVWLQAQSIEFLVGATFIFILYWQTFALAFASLAKSCLSSSRIGICLKDTVALATLVAGSTIVLFAGSMCLTSIALGAGPGFCAGLFTGVALALESAAIFLRLVTLIDPPLPNLLIRPSPPDDSVNVGTAQPVFPQTHPAGPLTASLASALTQISQQTDLAWADSALLHTFTFSELSAASATLYQNGAMVAQGALQIESAALAETAVLQGSTVAGSASGQGRHTFYAAALPGLGAGTNWLDYTAVLTASQPYTFTLADADITVNGSDEYSGALSLVVAGATTINGRGATAASTFAPALTGQLQDGRLLIGPAQGTFLVDGQPLDVSNGVAVAGYTGPITLSETTVAADQLEFGGEAHFFTLHLSATTVTDPYTPVTLTPLVAANFSDTYTLTAEAPPGWDVVVADTGLITAVPPPGAAPDDYLILVTIQSVTYPDLFASAIHAVTTTATSGLDMAVTEEPLITVPMGTVLDAEAFIPGHNAHLDNGRAEVPGAAYNIIISNTSTISHPFDITVSGLPAGWLVLSGASGQSNTRLTLPAGGVGRVGFYISPTVTAILPPGVSHTLDVTVSAADGSGLSANQTLVWTMPAVAFPYLKLLPTTIYALPDSTTAVDLQISNVGNNSGAFTITNTASAHIYGGQTYVPSHTLTVTPAVFLSPNLDSGQASQQSLLLDTSGALLGEQYVLSSRSAAGAYQPAAYALVQIVSPNMWPIFAATNQTRSSCTLGEPGLSAALENLALALSDLEIGCEAGSCSLATRDQVVTALPGVVTYAAPVSPLLTADTTLQTIAATMAAHSSAPDLEADITAISTAVANLAHEVCELSEHQPDVRFTPYLDAVLLGDTATFTLTVTNEGTLTSTYAVSATTPTGIQNFNTTLVPGESTYLPVSTAPVALGSYDVTAEIVPTGPDVTMAITKTAVARLNVVDKFVQVTAVAATPTFVETGTSSTSLSVDVTNVANTARAANARTAILAPSGGISYTSDVPLTLLIGPPQTYELTSVDTSGWEAGFYTITVELLDARGELIPDGYGLGYLGVGQALAAGHAVYPEVVSPVGFTVTTVITTEVLAAPALPLAAPVLHPWPERDVISDQESLIVEPLPLDTAGGAQLVAGEQPLRRQPETLFLTTWAISRTEDSDAAVSYSGSWTAVTNATADHASSGNFHSSQTTGDVVSFSFNGTWVGVGFATNNQSGYGELFLDGVSQGLVDLYSRNPDVKRVTLSGLADTNHVLTVTVTGLQNPFSGNDQVYLDYFDTWDGSDMPAGQFEQDDGRVWLSDGWVSQNDANASGGRYYRSGQTAWFPFTTDGISDSITLQAMTHANSEKMALYMDDGFLGYYDSADFSVHPRTFTFAGLDAGPHVLTVRAYRGVATLDTFTTPATEPATSPPVIGSFHRFEENDLGVLYNGFPLPQTANTWSSGLNDVVSDHYYAYSDNAGDTAQFTFTGTAVVVGFYAETRGGYAELFLDGVSQGVIDTYRRSPTVLPVILKDLANTTHTVTITVLGQANPLATNDRAHIDYFDVWDGAPLPDGVFEELDSRVYRSYRFSLLSDPQASGGQYLQDSITSAANVWFPFSGDSVTVHAIAGPQGARTTQVYLDGQPLTTINLYNSSVIRRTFSFQDLGPGLHLLHLERYRGELAVDAFTTPGVPPFVETPVDTGVIRYEEDDAALLYNGVPFSQRPQSWSEESGQWVASGGYNALSTTAGDTVSLTFDGRWAQVGFLTNQYGGQAEIFIDGLSQGTIGLYSAAADVTSFVVGDLITGTHTLSVTVLGLPDPPSPQSRVYLDYIDIWDGQRMPDEIVNASLASNNGRVHLSASLTMAANPNAINGDFVNYTAGSPDANVWYAFTGESFTYYGFSFNNDNAAADVYVDGQFQETVSLSYPFAQQPLAFHFDGLEDGPHVVRINNNSLFRVDAFASNQLAIPYQPLAEWWESDRSGGASIWGGVHVPPVVGDVTGDGAVEVVVATSNIDNNGELFLMRGDGQDAGGGDPIIWSVPFNIFNGFEDVGAPAIAELDGQPGAEIIMSTVAGMYAFHSDGSTYWFTDTVKPHVFFGTPAIGNLDLDAEPEIVINMDETLAVFEPDGHIAWTFNDVDGLTMPLLVDLTGDGLLDILFHDWNNTLYLYDYNLGNPQLVWTAVFANHPHGYGAPAVADLDGDGTAEVAIATETVLYAVNGEDGSVQWSAPLDPGRTGGVTIADLDGDGNMELVTSSLFNGGTLYAFEADGTLKWSAAALDTSPLNVSTADLDGDGAYEILWNGVNQGFTIYDGSTGTVRFNDPLVFSTTGSDVPVAADVDLDGYAEVVVPAQGGIRVYGFDGVWGPARSVWNQLNYHITNIEDDLTVPFNEANSWQTHNTYRTQTAPANVLPSYQVMLTHTVGITGVTVLSGTFSVPPGVNAGPVYGWQYAQTEANPVVTRTFASELSGLQPGEALMVAQGTLVHYTLPSGGNQLQLPPLYVSVPHIVAVSPATQTVGAGGTAVYDIVLSNPTTADDTYTLSLAGLPGAWLAYPAAVSLAAGSMATVSLTVTVPTTAAAAENPFIVNVSNGSGHHDQASASLLIIDGLMVTIDPLRQTATSGKAVTYTLTLTNWESIARTYDLAAGGLAHVTLPATVTVAANSSTTLAILAQAAGSGPYPFTVRASTNTASASDDAVLNGVGDWGVTVALAPEAAVAGPGTPADFTVTLRNVGSLADVYDLTASLPPGWSYRFAANGDAVSSIALTPHVFNQAELQLLLTPGLAAAAGDYDISVMAHSQGNLAATAVATATVQVLPGGVQVAVSPAALALDPADNGVWQVTITNTGSVADSYWLTATGIVALSGQFSTNPVSLSPGQAADVTLTTAAFPFVLATRHPFAVVATSQNDDRIQNQASAEVTFTSYEAVDVTWLPPSRTLTNTLTASFMLLITNTGNMATTYDLSVAAPGLSLEAETNTVYVPPHMTAAILVTAVASADGTYTLTGAASSSAASDTDTALLIVDTGGGLQPPVAHDDMAVTGEDTPVIIAVLANDTDPDNDPLTVSQVTQPANGTAVINGDDTITYTPDNNFNGTDAFTYTADDGFGGNSTATVYVTITAVNDAPTAVDDAAVTDEGVAVIIPVLANDSDVDNNTLFIDSVTQAVYGTALINPDNTITYTPEAGFNGVDTFTYVVSDGQGGLDTATVTVTVYPIAAGCNLYPIVLHTDLLNGVQPGDILPGILHGTQPGNFGWLTWTGDNGLPALVTSLTPPGDSHTYTNPNDPNDHIVSIDDWVEGKTAVSNPRKMQHALNELMLLDIVVPIWDVTVGSGTETLYQVSGFATIRMMGYDLSGQDQLTVQFLGLASCDNVMFSSVFWH